MISSATEQAELTTVERVNLNVKRRDYPWIGEPTAIAISKVLTPFVAPSNGTKGLNLKEIVLHGTSKTMLPGPREVQSWVKTLRQLEEMQVLTFVSSIDRWFLSKTIDRNALRLIVRSQENARKAREEMRIPSTVPFVRTMDRAG